MFCAGIGLGGVDRRGRYDRHRASIVGRLFVGKGAKEGTKGLVDSLVSDIRRLLCLVLLED